MRTILVAIVAVSTFSCSPERCNPAYEVCDDSKACAPSPDKTMRIGSTGLSSCNEGKCQTTGKACQRNSECFVTLQDGDDIPTWNRPQGGLGTRLNVAFSGFAAIEPRATGTELSSMRWLFLRELEGVSCDPELCADDICECNTAGDFTCVKDVPGFSSPQCAIRIGDQTSRRFPVSCLDDGSVAVEEFAIRFSNRWQAADLDGIEVTAYSILQTTDGQTLSHQTQVELKFGDFVKPSWWDDL